MNIIHIMNKKNQKKFRNLRKLMLCISFLSFGISGVAKQETSTAANNKIYWSDASGQIFYSVNATPSPVVKIALDLFSNDMKAVTGFQAKAKPNAIIQVYQLDQLNKKESAALAKLGLPLHQVTNKKETFYITTYKNKIIVAGSDARGTAYGVMELSRMAGVSPWLDWNDLQPQRKKYISTLAGFNTLQTPDVEYRGLALNNASWLHPQNYSRICRQMLRLRANTLWQIDSKHEAAYNKAVVDSFDICIGESNKITDFTGKKHKKHKKTVDNLKYLWNNNQLWMSNTSPALLVYDLTQQEHDDVKGHKTHNNSSDEAWIINVRSPKLATYHMALFMDMAWNKNAVNSKNIEKHQQAWLVSLFGEKTGNLILPIMKEYYRLTNIRQPEHMTKPFGDTEFHSGEFGNELEKYLYAYDILKQKVVKIEKTLPKAQNDGFFEIVKYPVFSAALIAEKELEAQEARYIARPGLFEKDDEAKTAAALSLNAFNSLKQLNAYYERIRNGKWKGFIGSNTSAIQKPTLPGQLSDANIKRYVKEAANREEEVSQPFAQYNDIVAKNACDWATITRAANSDPRATVQPLPLLGHSNKAVKMPQGYNLNYTFYTDQSGDARFTIAALPNLLPTKDNMRVSVSIDHATPVVCQLKEAYDSKEWKLNFWKGQALKSFYVTLRKGNHTVQIKALDDNVILDQWILDFDVDREYYMIPVKK